MPPDHTRLRRTVAGALTRRRVEELRPATRALAEGLVDAMEAAGAPADLVTAYPLPLPVAVVCDLLGVPEPAQAPDPTHVRHQHAVASGHLCRRRCSLLQSAFPQADRVGSLEIHADISGVQPAESGSISPGQNLGSLDRRADQPDSPSTASRWPAPASRLPARSAAAAKGDGRRRPQANVRQPLRTPPPPAGPRRRCVPQDVGNRPLAPPPTAVASHLLHAARVMPALTSAGLQVQVFQVFKCSLPQRCRTAW